MRYGVRLPNSGPFASPEAIASVADAAERLGYDAVMPHDHITWGYEDRYHCYAGSAEQVDAVDCPTDFYEATSTLSYLAGITQRVQLIPAALCLSWRPVILLARQALTLHRLAGGRFVLCVCVGNVRRDFEVTGTPWQERGRIAVEKLKVLRTVIDRPSPISFEGNYVKFKDAVLTPRPEGLSLWWAGGGTDIAIKRAARYAEGLMGANSPDFFRRKIPELRKEAERVGRGDVAFQFATVVHTCVAASDEEAWRIGRKTVDVHFQSEWMQRHDASARRGTDLVGSPETVAAAVSEYKAAGVTLLGLGFVGHSQDSLLEQMELFAREVMPRVG